jgi:hypothetical protein
MYIASTGYNGINGERNEIPLRTNRFNDHVSDTVSTSVATDTLRKTLTSARRILQGKRVL